MKLRRSTPGRTRPALVRPVLADVARAYRRAWWRLIALVVAVGILATLAVWVVARASAAVVPHLHGLLVRDGRVHPAGVIEMLVGMAVLMALLCLPVLAAGTAAAVRMADSGLEGRRPSVVAALLRGFGRVHRLIPAGAIALVTFLVLFVLSPLLSVVGLAGLILTPPVRLVSRRWARPFSWWPSVRSLGALAVPFCLALRWLAAALMAVPAVVLDRRSALGGLRQGLAVARRNTARILVVTFLALLATLILTTAASGVGYLADANHGELLGQGLSQLLFICLPALAVAALYRSLGGSGLTGAGGGVTGSPGSGGELVPAWAGTGGGSGGGSVSGADLWERDDNEAGSWRHLCRRTALLMPVALVGTLLAMVPAAPVSATSSSTLTMTVNSSADPTDPTTLATDTANCVSGSGECTLRAALAAASQDADADGYTGVSIGFSSDMTISLSAANGPLTFDDTSSSCGGEDDGATGQGRGTDSTTTTTTTPTTTTTTSTTSTTAPTTTTTVPTTTTTAPVTGDAGTTDVDAAVRSALLDDHVLTPHLSSCGGTFTIDGAGHQVAVDGGSQTSDMELFSRHWAFDVENLELENGSALTDDSGTSQAWGGGLYITGKTGTIVSAVTFDNDEADFGGGGLYSVNTVEVVNSTFVNDTAKADNDNPADTNDYNNYQDYGDGGADVFSEYGTATLLNDTFVNSAGGSIATSTSGGSVDLDNSVIDTDNDYVGYVPDFDCRNDVTAVDTIVYWGDTTCSGATSEQAESEIPGVYSGSNTLSEAPGLPPVARLVPGTPGNIQNPAFAEAGNDGVDCPSTDEWGRSRPSTGCDAGAYQYDPTTSVSVDSDDNPAVSGDSVTFTATVSMANEPVVAQGTVQLYSDGDALGSPVTETTGTATYTTSALAVGGHSITADFVSGAPASYADSSTASALDQEVESSGTTVDLTSDHATAALGSTVHLTVTVTGASGGVPTGTVDISDQSTDPATDLTPTPLTLDGSGRATLTTSTLAVGPHQLVATYSGDTDDHSGTSAVLDQDIQAPSSLSVQAGATDSAFGVPITFTAPVDQSQSTTPTGSVYYSYTAVSGLTEDAATLVDGTATWSVSDLPVGTTDVMSATYQGDSVYAPSAEASSPDITITQASSSTTLGSLPTSDVAYGAPVTITATVADTTTDSTADPDGTVTFKQGSTVLGTGVLTAGTTAGTATASYSTTAGQLPVGDDPVTAVYGGSDSFTGSSSTAGSVPVADAATTIGLTSSLPSGSTYGQDVTLTATVTAGGGSLAVPTGTVTFTDGTTVLGTSSLSAGIATLGVTSLPVGSDDVTAIYNPTGSFDAPAQPATVTQQVGVSPTSTSVSTSPVGSAYFGASVLVTVTVAPSGNGGGTPTGSVVLTDGSTSLGTLTLSGGEASTTLSGLAVGPHDFSAVYTSADGSYATSDGSAPYTVGQASTATSLSASATEVSFGDSVTLTATVTNTTPGSSAAPSGTVTFSDGAALGSATLTEIGPDTSQAVLITTALPSTYYYPHGYVQVTATFPAGDDFGTSTSSPVDMTVDQDQTSVSLSATSLTIGLPTTLTATINVTSGAGSPTGSVLFESSDDDGTLHNLGTVTVSDGQAVLSNVVLPTGTVELLAVYSTTDPGFVAGPPGTLQVALGRTTPLLSLGITPSSTMVYGTSYTLTATMTGIQPRLVPSGSVSFTAVNGSTSTPLGSAPLTAPATGDNPYTATLTGGVAIPVGTTSITASYGGDTNYTPASDDLTSPSVTAAPTAVTLSVSPQPVYVGHTTTISATVSNSSTGAIPAGSVVFTEGSTTLGTVALDGSGDASVTTTFPSTAGATVTATYQPTADFLGSASSTAVSVTGLPVLMGLSVSPNPVVTGQSAVFTAWVQPQAQYQGLTPLPPSGQMTVSNGGVTVCTITLAAASGPQESAGSCSAKFATSGTYYLTATYPGDSFYAGSTALTSLSVGKQTPTMTISSTPADWLVGQPASISWAVTGPTASDGTTTADGKITVDVDATQVCTSTELAGSCAFTPPSNFDGATADVFAIYDGDDAWNTANASMSVTVGACVVLNAPTIEPAAGGTVKVLTPTNCGTGVTAGYTSGTNVIVSETANTGYSFREWLDGTKTPTDVINVGLYGPITTEAIFDQQCVTVALYTSLSPRGPANTILGRVNASPAPNCPSVAPDDWQYQPDGSDTASYAYGTSVTFTPVAPVPSASLDGGAPYVFEQWSSYGQTLSNNQIGASPLTLAVTANLDLYASFQVPCYHGISFPAPAGGTATLSPAPNCQDLSGTGYSWGTTLTLSTSATGLQYFQNWGGSPVSNVTSTASGSTATALVTSGNVTFTASYGTCVQFSVAESGMDEYSGDPFGTVSVSPTGTCPTQGAGWYTPGSQAVINTTAVPGSNGVEQAAFVGWSGPAQLPAPSDFDQQLVTVTAATSGTETAVYHSLFGCASFTQQVIPPGAGTISTTYQLTGDGNCPAGTYEDDETSEGSRIDMTVTPTHGNPLLAWSISTDQESEDGGTQPLAYTGLQVPSYGGEFLGPSSATAWVCEAIEPQLTLVAPDGTSQTEAAPGGTDFVDAYPQPDCPLTDAYTVGSTVIPEANADPSGYKFVGWSGAASGSAIDGTPFTLDGSQGGVTLTATYDVICYTLTTNVTTADTYPAPNCPDEAASKNMYIGGTRVTMQQSTPSGDDFDGFTGSPDGTSGSYAWVTLQANTSVYADYTAKSVKEKIDDAFTSAGNAIAISAKKVVGVVAAAAGGIMLGVNPVTGIAGLAVLGGSAVSTILSDLGVHGAVLDGLNEGLQDVSQTLSMLTAALTCGTVWSANANTDNSNDVAVGQLGNVASAGVQAAQATEEYDEKLADAQESASSAQDAEDEEAIMSDAGPGAIDSLSKYGSRLGVVGAIGAGVYNEVQSGPNTGWDSSASAAWTGGGDVYNACLDAAEPSYFGDGAPADTASSPGGNPAG